MANRSPEKNRYRKQNKHREHHGQAQHPGVEDKMYLPKIEFVSLLQSAGGRLRLTDSRQVT
jgi:hypothetical protein